MKQLRFTQKDFFNYLTSLNPRTKAGFCGDSLSCPIAKAMTQKFGMHMFTNGSYYGPATKNGYLSHETAQKSPLWIKKFVGHIDSQASTSFSISASRALKIFKRTTKKANF